MDIRIVLSLVATFIAVVSYITYIRDMVRGTTKPHAFSWFVWSIVTYIAAFAQLSDGGGVGTIVSFTTATICTGISIAAWVRHRQMITRTDWCFFIASLFAIVPWILTKDALLSVVLASTIDLAAFVPSIRKSYNKPYSETLNSHALSTLKHCLTIASQQHYSVTTVFFPASVAVTTALFSLMLVIRRQQVPRPAHPREHASIVE